MSLLTLLLMNLRKEIQVGRREYLCQKQAFEMLKKYTGQDFGYDFDQWELWIAQHPEPIPHSSRITGA